MLKRDTFNLILIAVLAITLTAIGKEKPGKGVGHNANRPDNNASEPQLTPGKNAGGAARPDAKFAFTGEERRALQGFVTGLGDSPSKRTKHLPPGLAKKVARGEKLPPGWEKKCVPGVPMPPDLFEKCHPLPPELVVKLPPAPEPTITVAVGGKVVRLLNATREILDVFDVDVRF